MFESLIPSLMSLLEQPKADLEKNTRALLEGWLQRMDLVTREQLERQEKKLYEAQQTLAALNQRIAQLEKQLLKP